MRVQILKVREHDAESNADEIYINWDMVNWNFDGVKQDLIDTSGSEVV